MKKVDFSKCEEILDKVYHKKRLNEAIVLIEDLSGEISWNKGYNRDVDSQFNLASVTKLFVTTVILQLVEAKKIALDNKISAYLDEKTVKGLHIYKGVDYSEKLEIKHLLFQTSGLPDYYFTKNADGISFEDIMWEKNSFIPFDEMIAASKKMKPVFAPGRAGRSYYADINFDLLGKIIENILGERLDKVFEERIIEPLSLCNTYIVSEERCTAPKAYKKGVAHDISQFLKSCPASGGGVTTAKDFMIFMKAFWTGKLFSKDLLDDLKAHNRLQMIYGCIRYSGGHMYMKAGYPFQKKYELRGHSGASGSFAFYCEETGMFFVGDLNDNRSYLPANMLLKMENAVGIELKK